MSKTIGVVGFGNFGKFIVPHLVPFFDVRVCDAVDIPVEDLPLGVDSSLFESVVSCDIVVFAVPVQNLESVLVAAAPYMKEGALALDVSSVKVLPMELMLRCLPSFVHIVGTHPLFGPESGKDGIGGLKMVLCEGRGLSVPVVRAFCERHLGLEVLVRTPESHDREMAMVQGLTHFLAKALVKMDLKPCEMDTLSYNRMFDIMKLVGHDSMALFETIQNHNPYAGRVRADFMDAFKSLEDGLFESKS